MTDTPVFDDAGVQVATIGVSVDVTEQLLGEETAARLSAIVESSNDAIFSAGLGGLITTWNSAATALYGYEASEIVGRHLGALAPPAGRQELSDLLGRIGRGETAKSIETVGLRADNSEFHVAISISPIRDATGAVTGTSTIARDVSERVELLRQLGADRQRLADAQASARLGSFETNIDTGLMTRSDEMWRILGRDPQEIAVFGFDHIHPEDRSLVRDLSDALVAGQPDAECTYRIVRPDGEIRWVLVRASRFQDPSSRVIAGTMLDITERHLAEMTLAHQATHDMLTGLANRTGLTECLRSYLASPTRPIDGVAVAVMDLDQFKLINDTVGHEIGDLTLLAVAERLRLGLPAADVVARFGGDEFVLVRAGVGSHSAAKALATEAVHCLTEPIRVGDRQFQLTASVGVTLSAQGDTPESLIRDSQSAMYQAKDDGRAQIAMFDAAAKARTQRRLKIETDLRQAIDQHQLHVVYQPVLKLSTLEVVGFESLLRWDHPVLGSVAPTEFIPIAERSAVILSIGDWVLRHSLKQLASWRQDERTPADLWIAVNVSATQLGQPGLVDAIHSAIDEAGLPASRLHVEITESVLVDRVDNAIAAIAAIRALGVQVSLDDFGSGYSSLSYLNRLPINTVKIDRSFVQSLRDEGHNASIVRAIIALAETLGHDVIAEGIEHPYQLQFLRELGCGYGQGYLFSKPLKADDAYAWTMRHTTQPADTRAQFTRYASLHRQQRTTGPRHTH